MGNERTCGTTMDASNLSDPPKHRKHELVAAKSSKTVKRKEKQNAELDGWRKNRGRTLWQIPNNPLVSKSKTLLARDLHHQSESFLRRWHFAGLKRLVKIGIRGSALQRWPRAHGLPSSVRLG